MKNTLVSILTLMAMILCTSCDDYETYGEKKEKERDAIEAFIAKNGIKVIDEATFEAKGQQTSMDNNEYVSRKAASICR